MRVALYHPWIYLKSGLERTILEIARRSRHEWIIYTSHFDGEGTYPQLKDYGVRETHRVSVKRSYGAVLSAAARVATTRLDLDSADALVVCCDGIGSFVTLRNGGTPIVNLCFTPLRAVYDAEYRARHLARRPLLRLPRIAVEKAYAFVDRLLWRRYASVVCISETVRERAAAGGLYPREAMRVMYPGVDERLIRASDRFEPFFFLPGRIMWTKNVELGIAAFHEFRRSQRVPYELVIAGMVDAKSRGYFDDLRRLAGVGEGVRFHVSPTDADMNDYYARCSAVLFTAFNEDLGLTPMESMARGKPVIAVDRGGPREVVEHEVTGLLVDAEPARFAEAMALLTADEARMRAMGKRGVERVRRFTWERFVGEFDDLLEQTVVAGERRPAPPRVSDAA